MTHLVFISPAIAASSDDFPDPTLPTMSTRAPFGMSILTSLM